MIWVKDFMNRAWMGRLSEEECLLGQAKSRSSINPKWSRQPSRKLQWQGCAPEMYKKEGNPKKYLRESYYYCIKCITTTFLAAFMSRRSLNSAILATITHRRPEGVSDGTSTQVATQLIDKCRMKRVQEGLYNRKDPPWGGDRKNSRKNTVAI